MLSCPLNPDHREQIRELFGAMADLHYRFWGEFLHLAVLEEPDQDREAAYLATHWRYLRAILGQSVRRILDVGCEGGAFAEWLARETNANSSGRTVTR